MRAAVLALVSALVVAGSVVVLAIRRRAAEWARWEALDEERTADERIVGMPTWPYRGEVS